MEAELPFFRNSIQKGLFAVSADLTAQAKAMTMTSDLCVEEGRERRRFPAEINQGSYH